MRREKKLWFEPKNTGSAFGLYLRVFAISLILYGLLVLYSAV